MSLIRLIHAMTIYNVQANELIESSQRAAFGVMFYVILLTTTHSLTSVCACNYACTASVLYDLQTGSELSGAFANFHEDLFHCRQRQTETGEPQTVPLTCVYMCVYMYVFVSEYDKQWNPSIRTPLNRGHLTGHFSRPKYHSCIRFDL